VLSEVANMMKAAAGLATGGKLAQGFSDGFKAAGGPQGVADIIKSVFHLFGKLLIEIIKAAPMEAAIVAALVGIGPAIAAAVSTSLVGGIAAGLGRRDGGRGGVGRGGFKSGAFRGAVGLQGPMATSAGVRGLAAGAAVRGAGKQATGAMSRVAASTPGLSKAGAAARGGMGAVVKGVKMKGIGLAAAGIIKLSTMGSQMAKLGKFATNFGKSIPGLNVAFAGLDFAARKAEGQDTGKAASGAAGGLAGSIVGGAIGTAILPGVGTAIGAVLGGALGSFLGEQLPAILSGLPGMLTAAFQGIIKFFQDIPYAFAFAVGFTVQSLQNAWIGVVTFFQNLPAMMVAAWAALVAWARSLPSTIGSAFNSFISFVKTIPSQITSGLSQVGSAIINWVTGLPARVMAQLGAGYEAGKAGARPANAKPNYNGKGRSMPLHQAIATEMKYKPQGSSLVIANSSERVIPAYKGYSPASLYASSAANGFSGGGNMTMSGITINVNGGNAKEVADEIASELLSAMYRKSRSEVLTS
jgi:hypothetical protein